MADRVEWLIISAAWMVGAFGSSWVLARLYRHLHPELSFYKLWAFWAIVVMVVAAAVFGLGLV